MKATVLQKILLFIWRTVIAYSSYGQYKIIDAATREPVPFAHIQWGHPANGTTADIDGQFWLDTTWTPQDTLVVSCIG